jgi:type IV pilus assembly protein PilB
MVGEIRDQATAEMAVRAAQTGHLLLSSLHSEEACGAVARLRNLGIPAYNLVATVRLVIAQRLMRRLHHCCRPHTPSVAELRRHGFTQVEIERWQASGAPLYSAVGCAQCHQGYRGRVGAFEVLPLSATMMAQIMDEQPVAALREQAHREGITDLRGAARAHVLSGVTSLDELQRLGLPTLH